MKTCIKWGILGTSYISEVMAKAIQESQTSQLVAIGSRSLITAKSFSETFSIPKMYDNYQNVLNDEEIDAIYIGLPNHLHKEWIIRCAEAGKHILCEKPLVISVDEAKEVISAIKTSDVLCMEGLMYQSHPFIHKIQEIIQSKILGDIKLYNATYCAPIAHLANATAGGSIRNLGCYPISLIRLLANAEPIEILGTGRINCQNGTDNQGNVVLKFLDNSIAVVSTADDIQMSWLFEIYGSEGILKVITNPWLPERDNNKIQIYINNEVREINIKANQSLYTYQIDRMNRYIIENDFKSFKETTLLNSLGNTNVLESWRQQVNEKRHL